MFHISIFHLSLAVIQAQRREDARVAKSNTKPAVYCDQRF